MNRDQIMGLIRHILTTVGGGLVTNGYFDEATGNALLGGIMAVIGLVWSWTSKTKPQPNAQ